jgi:hypothetical protein
MKELLSSIGITEEGHMSSGNNYIIDLDDSDHYNRIFSKLDKSDLVEENEDSSVVNLEVTNILYLADGYSLNLIADFDQDTYKLVVTELEDEEE